jgi:hypothetical protein
MGGHRGCLRLYCLFGHNAQILVAAIELISVQVFDLNGWVSDAENDVVKPSALLIDYSNFVTESDVFCFLGSFHSFLAYWFFNSLFGCWPSFLAPAIAE